MCRCELVSDATPSDRESVLGEECHIVSGKPQGPRYDPGYPPERLDDPENLVLLCGIHHKMVDDQHEAYTAPILQELKDTHEKWVTSTLSEPSTSKPIRVKRIKGNIPTHLPRVTTGQEVMRVVGGACAFSFTHDEPETEEEVELLSGFLQEAQEYGDLWSDIEAGARVQATFQLSRLIRELGAAGFWVFGIQEVQQIEGGAAGPSPWPVAVLTVIRSTNPDIIQMGSGGNLKSAVRDADS